MNRIIEGVRQFQRDVFPPNRDLFRKLATAQNPEALFIACSDSRISLEWITQCRPGELFVCRNAGNMAPPCGDGDGISATIEYAVSVLYVGHIVVCGHSDCGAMKGLLYPEKLAEMPDVKGWLRKAESARQALAAAAIPVDSPAALPELTKLNVRLQLDYLRARPQVSSRLRAGTLQLHGWIYQIESGEVLAWNDADDRWVAVQELGPQACLEAQHA